MYHPEIAAKVCCPLTSQENQLIKLLHAFSLELENELIFQYASEFRGRSCHFHGSFVDKSFCECQIRLDGAGIFTRAKRTIFDVRCSDPNSPRREARATRGTDVGRHDPKGSRQESARYQS
jgi:hypothetical protein